MSQVIKVCQSHEPGHRNVIRVYQGDTLVAEEYITKRKPLDYLRTLTRSKHFTSIECQLMEHGLTLSDVGIEPAKKPGGLDE